MSNFEENITVWMDEKEKRFDPYSFKPVLKISAFIYMNLEPVQDNIAINGKENLEKTIGKKVLDELSNTKE